MMKLGVLEICLVSKPHSEAGIVLSLFLIFGYFEPRYSYKIVLIKIQRVQKPSPIYCLAGKRDVQ